MRYDVHAKIRQFVVDNFLFGRANGMADDASFMQTGTIDSTGILELLSFLEAQYDIVIEEEDLIPENLDSINKVAAFVARKRGCDSREPVTHLQTSSEHGQ